MRKLSIHLAGLVVFMLLQSCDRTTDRKETTAFEFALEDQDGKKWSHIEVVNSEKPFSWSGIGQGPVIEQGSLYHEVKEIKRSGDGATLHVRVWRQAKDDGSFVGFQYDKNHYIKFDQPFSETIAPGILLKGQIKTIPIE